MQKKQTLLLLFAAGLLRAQQPVPAGLSPASAQLARIRAHMAQVLLHEPNYTCVETMERTRRVGPAHKFEMQDTLRMEVALVEGKELFAWPGSKKFETDDLRKMISGGAYGNGAFALFARAVFMTSAATFTYHGEDPIQGRDLIRYDFVVSRLASGYQIRVGEREAVVSYHGSFWADPKTLDAARLEVFGDDIPPYLGLSYSSDRIDYARIQIGDQDFLLPSESEMDMREPSGVEDLNFVRFSSCRQYTGESVLRFDDVTGPDTAQKAPEEIVLPGGLEVRVELQDDIRLATAAGGDEVHATLAGDLKYKGTILAAKGATVLGRITRVERYANQIVLGITFSDMYGDGKHAGLSLNLDRVLIGQIWNPPVTSVIVLPHPHEGLIHVPTGRAMLRRGILMYWRT